MDVSGELDRHKFEEQIMVAKLELQQFQQGTEGAKLETIMESSLKEC